MAEREITRSASGIDDVTALDWGQCPDTAPDWQLAGARLSQPQRAAKPDRVERVMPRCSANTVRANFAAIWPGHVLRLGQPRSGAVAGCARALTVRPN